MPNVKKIHMTSFGVDTVNESICIIYKARRRDILLFKEALNIKKNSRHLIVVSKRPPKFFQIVSMSNGILTINWFYSFF